MGGPAAYLYILTSGAGTPLCPGEGGLAHVLYILVLLVRLLLVVHGEKETRFSK